MNPLLALMHDTAKPLFMLSLISFRTKKKLRKGEEVNIMEICEEIEVERKRLTKMLDNFYVQNVNKFGNTKK